MPTSRVDEALRAARIHLAEVDSTNAYALRRADALPHSTVIVADRQTSGRGRAGRHWHSPAGNLYMTLVLKEFSPIVRSSGLGWLPLAMAMAVARCLEELGLSPGIKWPNDVLLPEGKVAGILAEARWQQGRPATIALGAGVNLNMPLEEMEHLDVPVASAAQARGQPVDRDDFAENLLDQFRRILNSLEATGPEELKQEIYNRAWFLGRNITVSQGPRALTGRAVGIDDQGALMVEDALGQLHTVLAGDVTCW